MRKNAETEKNKWTKKYGAKKTRVEKMFQKIRQAKIGPNTLVLCLLFSNIT